MYVKPVARHCWLSGLRRRPLRLLRASGMAKDAVDVLNVVYVFVSLFRVHCYYTGRLWKPR